MHNSILNLVEGTFSIVFFRFAYSSVNHTTKGRLLTSFCCGFYLHMRDSKQRWGTEGFCKAQTNKFVQIALQNPRRIPPEKCPNRRLILWLLSSYAGFEAAPVKRRIIQNTQKRTRVFLHFFLTYSFFRGILGSNKTLD